MIVLKPSSSPFEGGDRAKLDVIMDEVQDSGITIVVPLMWEIDLKMLLSIAAEKGMLSGYAILLVDDGPAPSVELQVQILPHSQPHHRFLKKA